MWAKVVAAVTWLSGKKTYLVSLLSVVDGTVQLINGGHWSQVLPYLLAGAFGGAIRAAIAKVEAQLPANVDAFVGPVIKNLEK